MQMIFILSVLKEILISVMREVTPVPIPNTEVKLFSADGSRVSPVRVRTRQAYI